MKKQANVIGVGKLGSKIASEFGAYPEYRVYSFHNEHSGRNCFEIDPESNIEDYERNFPSEEAAVFLRKIKKKEQVLLFLEGGDPMTGITLRLLSLVKDKRITVIYLRPEREIISTIQNRDDKVIFGFLKEYARSGLFDMFYVIDRAKVDDLIGETSVQDYENTFSYFVSYVVAMVNFFNNTDPVISNKPEPTPIDRICTLSVCDLEEDTISELYDLQDAKYVHFYYGIPEEYEDSNIITKVKSHAKRTRGDLEHTTYSVYETTLDKVLVFSQTFTSTIQSL